MSEKIQVECIGIGSKKVFSAWEIGCMKILSKYKNMCIGLSSETEDKQHCVFLDYDNIKYDIMKKELEDIAIYANLGHFIILETGTKRHYLVISLNKVSLNVLREIFKMASVDEWFKKVNSLYRDQAIIRISHRGKTPQPFFREIIKYGRSGNVISFAHYNFFIKTLGYPIKFEDGKAFDSYNKVKIFLYGSNKN